MIRKRWQILPTLPDEEVAKRLETKSLPAVISPLLVQLLHNRGVEAPADYEPFIAADDRLAHDSRLLKDIDRAVTRLLRALLGDELIAIYGDFDADGITATALMVEGISQMGGRVIYYIPHRIGEGHGLNRSALEGLREQGVGLVVTVDCGISEVSEVEEGNRLGLDIIITDHHVPPEHRPPAVAAIDPKRSDSGYPFYELSGVGVAFKLLQALWGATRRVGDEVLDDFLDLVALGTIADMVPLKGENRYLVKRGLEVLNSTRRFGLQEMAALAGLQMGKLDENSVSYAIGPRLNASGRMEHAVTSYELLTASSRSEARRLAAALEANNSERQRLTAEFLARAKEELLVSGAGVPLLMVGGADYPAGVAGVIAGKLTDEFYRPAIVLQLDGDTVRGSARSIPEFDIVSALADCRDLLTRFGGHRQAAGFVVPESNVDRLRNMLLEIADRELEGVDLRPVINVDTEFPLSSLSGETYKVISRMAPFGQGNQVPTFLSRNVKVMESRRVGGAGDHLKLKLRDGGVVWDAIAFDLGDREISPYIDIVYNLEKENWSGKQFLRLNVIDFAVSG